LMPVVLVVGSFLRLLKSPTLMCIVSALDMLDGLPGLDEIGTFLPDIVCGFA
jgi:hypothetical protein